MKLYREEARNMFKLAVPLALAQLAQNSTSFVDTVMVGKLGDEALAGIAIGATLFHFVSVVVAGVLYSVSAVVSQAVGAKELSKIGRAVRQGFWIAIFGFIPCMIVYWNAAPLLRWLGQDESVVRLSSGYLKAISFGMLPAMLIVALRGLLEGVSDTKPIVIVSVVGVGLNVFFNNALMFGQYGLPKLGLVGTGVASSIVYTLVFLMLAGYVWFKHANYQVFYQFRLPDPQMIGELLRVGTPIAITIFFEFSMFAACGFAMGVIGAKELAAHQIALQSASTTFMLPLGVALATTVRVGLFAGEGDQLRSKIAGQVGMMMAAAVMGLTALMFWLMPHTIVSLYLDVANPDNQSVVELAIIFLGIAALFQVGDGLQVAASAGLRGLKKTRAAMMCTLVAYWLVGLPACALLGFRSGSIGFGWGGKGLWYGLTVGLAAAALMLVVRFHWEFRGERNKRPGEN